MRNYTSDWLRKYAAYFRGKLLEQGHLYEFF